MDLTTTRESYSLSSFFTIVETMWLWTGVFSVITLGPRNNLVARCVDESVRMTCVTNENGTILWMYNSMVIITAPCQHNYGSFQQIRSRHMECGVVAWLSDAQNDRNFGTISGDYWCSDSTHAAVSTVILLGIVSSGDCFLYFRKCISKITFKVNIEHSI